MSRCNTVRAVANRWICAALLLLLLGGTAAADAGNFTLPGLDGRQYSLSDYRGKWVLVNYWATWCPPCLEELPELEVFHAGAGERAVVLGVNMEDIPEPRLRRFVERQFLSFPILVASARPDRSQLVGPVDGLPTSYLVAPSGEVVARQVGQVTADAINGFIDKYESRHGGGEN